MFTQRLMLNADCAKSSKEPKSSNNQHKPSSITQYQLNIFNPCETSEIMFYRDYHQNHAKSSDESE